MTTLARFLSCPARVALSGVGASALIACNVGTPAAALGHLLGVVLTLAVVAVMVAPVGIREPPKDDGFPPCDRCGVPPVMGGGCDC